MLSIVVLRNYILLTVVIVSAVTDVRKGLIYNWLTLPAIVVGLVISTWQSGWIGFAMSFLGILIGGGALFIPFCFGIMGGGDVKLMAAIGAFMGPRFVSEALLVSIMAGGIIGFGLMIVRGKLKPTLVWYMGCLKSIGRALIYRGIVFAFPQSPEVGTAPFAVSILIGCIISHYFSVLSCVGF
jgi:prepilin peptidase CpaA